MMDINRNNYEIFFLDYLDGKLAGNQVDQFLDFLELNPDLKEELMAATEMTIPSEEISFTNKTSLYKTENDRKQDSQYTAVAFMEGDLDELENKLFLKNLELHPEQNHELDLLMKTRLQADENVRFPDKKKLYKKSPAQKIIYWGSRVAAVLILAFGFWAVSNMDKDVPITTVAKQSVPAKSEMVSPVPNSVLQAQTTETKTTKNTRIVPVKSKVQTPQPTVVPERDKETLATISPKEVNLSSEPELTMLRIKEQPLLAENNHPSSEYYTLDKYFVEKVLKIEKKDPERRKSLLESGLELASNFSGKRFNYEKTDGKISKLSYESRMLAVSLPVGN